MPSFKPPPHVSLDPFRPTLARISACVLAVGRFLSLLASLPASELAHFSAGDWGRLVLAVVVAMRLSFPLAECPELDSAWAREQLGFGAFLDVMTREASAVAELTTAAKRVDVVSASRVVMMVVREKYEKRLAVLERQQREEQRAQAHLELPRPRCPMLDGSLESYFPFWGGQAATNVPPSMAFVDGIVQGDELLDAWGDDALDWINPEQDML
ncbi:hypothetical protein NLG97_g10443 [Lecanicillium saksenae]|uniref:Uncharacterized protein n=1 Tax=Lecanicillium saksenae TaxID=468837 RepID=A0ACC1QD64_9HYPO|nr:hypothetical protein NLG97_g10443 [Lecanicillium saksenae]